MPSLSPFLGARYAPGIPLKDVTCPPHDVISRQEQERLHRQHPLNAARLELPLPGGGGKRDYRRAARDFATWLRRGSLVLESEEAFYLYRIRYHWDNAVRTVRGVIGALELEPYGRTEGVLPHERTMPEPLEDRLQLLAALEVNVSPIYAIYRGGAGVRSLVTALEVEKREPAARFTDSQGVEHSLWVIADPHDKEALGRLLHPETLVIADGHHRYETALTFARLQGSPGAGKVMCFAVDADSEELTVLPYHRVLTSGLGRDELLKRIRRRAQAELRGGEFDLDREAVPGGHPLAFRFPNLELLWRVDAGEVARRTPGYSRPWQALDVVALHEVALPDLLPEGSPRLAFVQDESELDRLLQEDWEAGVRLRAVSAAEVIEIASSGERLPEKTSFFWPKPVTGLVFRPLAEEGRERQREKR